MRSPLTPLAVSCLEALPLSCRAAQRPALINHGVFPLNLPKKPCWALIDTTPSAGPQRAALEELAEQDALPVDAAGCQLLGELGRRPAGQPRDQHCAVAGVPAYRAHQPLRPLEDCAPDRLLHQDKKLTEVL